jgi:toxin ParE1/3/4
MIRWTLEASEDIEFIRDYISTDSPRAAAQQCDLILKAVDRIDRFPRSGRKSNAPKLREMAVPKTPYIIFYRLFPDTVVLVGILHGAMRRPRRLRR